MNNELKQFVKDFTHGAINHMEYTNKSTMYIDVELCDYLDIEEVEDKILNEVMKNIIIEIKKNEEFDCWIESSNEVTIERVV
jgi:hypothetical protein